MEGILEQILKEINNNLQGIQNILVQNKVYAEEPLPNIITVDDIKSYLHIGTTQAYSIINLPVFTKINMGRKTCIFKEQFLKWTEKEWRKKIVGTVK